MTEVTWPQKRRGLHDHHVDSAMWNGFPFRDDDNVLATYGKSGTTWTRQIVAELIFDGAGELPITEMSPRVDLRMPPAEVKLAAIEAQTHRRFLKTHLPVDALVYAPEAKYIYIGRDGHPFRPFWENVRSWWEIRRLPNLLPVHFADPRHDPEREIRRIAALLDIRPTNWARILEHTSFDDMKRHAPAVAPLGGSLWVGGAATFINKGTNGRWREVLTAEESAAYEARAEAELGSDCARWLTGGAAAQAVPSPAADELAPVPATRA